MGLRCLLVASAVLAAGCAGWSSWEDQAAPPPPRLAADEYQVVRGDTVYSIAFRNNLDYRELARWNGIGSDYLIRVGQVLRLKPPPASPKPKRINGEIESVGMDDVDIGRPRAVVPDSPPSDMPPPDDGVEPASSYAWVWPTAGGVVRAYGNGGARGLDFGGVEGQPVVAAAPGRVVYSGNALKGYGELIIIKHDDIYLSAYGYNRTRHVKEGDVVTAGQPIAEMGRGPENRPLLHFEIRRKGRPINPADKLPTKTASSR
ncbi:peptidoglycan DD-metalloendopeptidase family protein [Fontimonas sp. SYSU GA230001]|uniref:peptidoglycan DD-metalloendopeptidase family protein n=1 Tax=Fontimonas sp. SYSU GA230001 TaxID=3142450 RepID=UPI0032B45DE0